MTCSEPIQPIYDFSSAPELVTLLNGTAEFCHHGYHFSGEGSIQIKFIPTPMIVLQGRAKGSGIRKNLATKQAESANSDGDFVFNSINIESIKLSSQENSEGLQTNWTPNCEPVFFGDRDSKTTVTVIAHLFNFPNFRPVQDERTKAFGAAVVFLKSDDWIVMIQALPNKGTFSEWHKIKNQGGCFLTHVVKLERLDGRSFSEKEAEEQLEMLSCFLSFVKGQRLRTVCEVGLDNQGDFTWTSFAAPRLTDSPHSWFSIYKNDQMESLFPLFSKRWAQSNEWRETLRYAVYWYTQANIQNCRQITIDTAIIFIQAAWERLAYQYIVNERGMMSSGGYKGLKFSADKFRMLFSNLDIPTKNQGFIPKIIEEKWEDYPRAFVEIRNSLVHPESNNKVTGDCYIEAWKLGLWYLELTILGVCGYQGTYVNRLTAECTRQVENVPWVHDPHITLDHGR